MPGYGGILAILILGDSTVCWAASRSRGRQQGGRRWPLSFVGPAVWHVAWALGWLHCTDGSLSVFVSPTFISIFFPTMGGLALCLEWEALASPCDMGLILLMLGFDVLWGYMECLVANGVDYRRHEGGLDWLPCLSGCDMRFLAPLLTVRSSRNIGS